MILDDVKYIGVNDYEIDLFEGQYNLKNGMSYNSYAVIDEKIAIIDSVDVRFAQEWLDNISSLIGKETPDYIIVQHMEPDHSGSFLKFIEKYPDTTVVASPRTFTMIKNFFGVDCDSVGIKVGDGDELSLGKHVLKFISAPMVHWPEVIMTYDMTEKILFSADAFGTFGALDESDDDWLMEARRYYIGIVGKYGISVQAVLKKAALLDIMVICPLHGPVLNENIEYYLELYDKWSSYTPEEDGIVIAYTSVYGNTKKAVFILKNELRKRYDGPIVVYDLARCDMSVAVADSFRYSKIVLATTTYNGDIFPFMREFICHLTERGFTGRTVSFIENGSWAPMAARVMKSMFEKCKNLDFVDSIITIRSAPNIDTVARLTELSECLLNKRDI